jgi:hypothetical protein
MSLFERLPVTAALAHCLLTKTIWTKQLPRQPHPLLLQRATTKKVAPLDPPYPHSSCSVSSVALGLDHRACFANPLALVSLWPPLVSLSLSYSTIKSDGPTQGHRLRHEAPESSKPRHCLHRLKFPYRVASIELGAQPLCHTLCLASTPTMFCPVEGDPYRRVPRLHA